MLINLNAMKCPKCNHENVGGAKFFSNCATQLSQSNSCSCGATNIPSTAKFCPVCGATLNPVNTPQNVAEKTSKQLSYKSDKELLSFALDEYADEYLSFKKKWIIGLSVVNILAFLVYILIAPLVAIGIFVGNPMVFLAYKIHFLPQYEQELLQRYKRNHKLQ